VREWKDVSSIKIRSLAGHICDSMNEHCHEQERSQALVINAIVQTYSFMHKECEATTETD
jgi:hypothetical protein